MLITSIRVGTDEPDAARSTSEAAFPRAPFVLIAHLRKARNVPRFASRPRPNRGSRYRNATVQLGRQVVVLLSPTTRAGAGQSAPLKILNSTRRFLARPSSVSLG